MKTGYTLQETNKQQPKIYIYIKKEKIKRELGRIKTFSRSHEQMNIYSFPRDLNFVQTADEHHMRKAEETTTVRKQRDGVETLSGGEMIRWAK